MRAGETAQLLSQGRTSEAALAFTRRASREISATPSSPTSCQCLSLIPTFSKNPLGQRMHGETCHHQPPQCHISDSRECQLHYLTQLFTSQGRALFDCQKIEHEHLSVIHTRALHSTNKQNGHVH